MSSEFSIVKAGVPSRRQLGLIDKGQGKLQKQRNLQSCQNSVSVSSSSSESSDMHLKQYVQRKIARKIRFQSGILPKANEHEKMTKQNFNSVYENAGQKISNSRTSSSSSDVIQAEKLVSDDDVEFEKVSQKLLKMMQYLDKEDSESGNSLPVPGIKKIGMILSKIRSNLVEKKSQRVGKLPTKESMMRNVTQDSQKKKPKNNKPPLGRKQQMTSIIEDLQTPSMDDSLEMPNRITFGSISRQQLIIHNPTCPSAFKEGVVAGQSIFNTENEETPSLEPLAQDKSKDSIFCKEESIPYSGSGLLSLDQLIQQRVRQSQSKNPNSGLGETRKSQHS